MPSRPSQETLVARKRLFSGPGRPQAAHNVSQNQAFRMGKGRLWLTLSTNPKRKPTFYLQGLRMLVAPGLKIATGSTQARIAFRSKRKTPIRRPLIPRARRGHSYGCRQNAVANFHIMFLSVASADDVFLVKRTQV